MRTSYGSVLGITMGMILAATISSSVSADEGGSCQGRQGHAVGMIRHGGLGHSGMSGLLLRNKQELDLSEEQVAKLRMLSLDQDRSRIRAQADVLVAERELRALVWDEKTELSAIETKIKERESLEAGLRFMRIKAGRDLVAVLSPEQQVKLKSLREQGRDSHRHRMMKAETGEDATREEIAAGAPETEFSELDGGPSAG